MVKILRMCMLTFLIVVGVTQAQEITWRYRLASYIEATYNTSFAPEIVDKVIEVAEQRDLEPTLLLAIIAVESRFNPKASNKSGAKGLMQVMMPLHADKFDTPKMVYTIDSNVEVGAKIWHDCMQRSRNLNAAAKCYSGGSTSWLAKVKRVKKDLDNI